MTTTIPRVLAAATVASVLLAPLSASAVGMFTECIAAVSATATSMDATVPGGTASASENDGSAMGDAACTLSADTSIATITYSLAGGASSELRLRFTTPTPGLPGEALTLTNTANNQCCATLTIYTMDGFAASDPATLVQPEQSVTVGRVGALFIFPQSSGAYGELVVSAESVFAGGYSVVTGQMQLGFVAVPEPSTALLVSIGVLALAGAGHLGRTGH
ncbi:MAG: hypothetical protein R2724_34320 [Bryobacterales bacterium]